MLLKLGYLLKKNPFNQDFIAKILPSEVFIF